MQRLLTLLSILILSLLISAPLSAAPASNNPIPVQITVLSAETNKPIPGATIEFRQNSDRATVVARATTDTNGSATTSLPKGTYQYLTSATGMGTTRNYLYLEGQPREETKTWLNKAAAISGRLLDGTGKPLGGFRMTVDRLFSTTTDATGRFRFDNLDGRGHDLILEQAGWVLDKSFYPQPAAGETKQLGDMVVRRAATLEISGTLAIHKHMPSAEGVTLSLNGSSVWRNGKLDANGKLLLPMLPPGSYTLAVSDSRMERTEQQITLQEGERQQVQLVATTRPPSLEIEMYGDVILTNKPVALRSYGLWTDRAKVTVYQIPAESIIANRVNLSKPEEINSAGLKVVKSFPIALKPQKSDYRNRARFKLPPLSGGAYLVQLQGDEATARVAFIATDLGLIAKTAPDATLLQAVHIKTGKPLAKVALYGSTPQKAAAFSALDGTTNWDRKNQGNRVVGRLGGNLAVLTLGAEEGERKASDIKGYLYTERTAYRPSQTVFYKGVMRKKGGDDYQLPPTGKISIKVTDSGDKTVFEDTLTSSALGSFHGQLTLPATPTLGEYSIAATSGADTWQGSFKVLEYRKPEFEVKLRASNPFELGGHQIPLKLTARYYFGAPVANAKVVWRVYSQPWLQGEREGGGFGEESLSYDGYNEFVGEGEATLDANGEATIQINAKTHDQPVRYSIDADVTDPASRQVTGSTSLTIVPSLLDIRVKGEQYLLQPGKPSGFILRVADWQGVAKPNTPVALIIEQQFYDKKSRTYNWKTATTLRDRTGKDGAVRLSYRFPSSDYWRLRAETFDEGKRRSFNETYAWVWEQGSSWGGSYRELEAEFDKKSYKPGEKARLILRAPAQGGSLLLTLEGRRIHQSRIIPITSAVQVVEIPVTKELAPNIHVSASTIANGRFYNQQGLLKVEYQPGKLDLIVTPQQEVYAPGDTAKIVISSTTEGKPVAAEISLALVDEAIFAVAPETREEIYRFFRGRRDHLVRTIYSFPRLYLGGASKDLAKLAGDDDLKGIKVRKVFRDTAAWLPMLTSDSNGTVVAEAQLPDNLTKWRATAVGHTAEQQFGSGQASFISRLPFMARLAPPRFMVAEDRLEIPGLLNDASNKEQQVKGRFEATGLTLSGETGFTGNLPAGGSLRQNITVTATQPGQALLKLTAAGSEGKDALEMSFPVLARALQREQATALSLRSGQGEALLTQPAEALSGSGSISVTFSPTVAESLIPALEYLISFPYGCVEQTVSRFVPAVYAQHLLTRQGRNVSPSLQAKLPRIVAEGLQRLADLQHEDGGWGWWKTDHINPYLTALAMQGLATARQAGVTVDEPLLQRGKKAIEAQLENAKPEQAAVLYRALTAHGGSHPATEKRLTNGLKTLPPEAKIAVAEALENRGERQQAIAILQGLTTLLQRDSEAAWLPEGTGGWRWGGSSMESTAALLSAMSRILPEDPATTALARYLARNQRGGWWQTTVASAAGVRALADFVAASHELDASYTARLMLNNKEVERYSVEKGRLTAGRATLTLPADSIGNSLQLEKSNTSGTAYLSARLNYRVPVEQIAKADGLQVERTIYRISSVQKNGQWRHEYQPLKPGEPVQVGEDLEVRLSVRNKADLEYLILEDYLPAGFEVRQADRDPRYANEAYYQGWYDHKERRDTLMAWFIGYLPGGNHEFRFVVYPELKGTVTALPSAIWPMYRPHLRSESSPWQVEVR
ncbi:MAG: MG2 domain-containing protein [Trichlorobacter sp.]|uniref:carboxypeptidase regulatory-like domain-containing protein n=1 Tax=Trichlorobacter sp. TaxID=2911007 RepID=UPI0025621579|nr:carboxypeptidase regulatory-like domain-containing protein [Trichlorobacter sp.]MDK9717054.1 MG2 domain-containing protein [Trichlorobacter sp.]